MSVEMQWTDVDPQTGERRFVCVDKFAREWRFMVRFRRRENWITPDVITREMWETLLDGLERRYQRREGVTEADLKAVRQRLANLKESRRHDAESIRNSEVKKPVVADEIEDQAPDA